MPTRAAVALARCNVLLEKMREIRKWRVCRRVATDTAYECCGTWHLRASVINAQNYVKITDFSAVRAHLRSDATSLDSKSLRFAKDQRAVVFRSNTPRWLNCLTLRLLPSVVTSRIACPQTRRHIPQDVKL